MLIIPAYQRRSLRSTTLSRENVAINEIQCLSHRAVTRDAEPQMILAGRTCNSVRSAGPDCRIGLEHGFSVITFERSEFRLETGP